MKKLNYILCLSGLIALTQCTKREASPIGSEYFDLQDLSEVQHKTIYAAESDSSFFVSAETGAGDFFYIGHMKDIHAASLIQFAGIEDTSDVDSAVVFLNIYRTVNNNDIPGEIHVYQASSSWDELTLTQNDFDASLIGKFIGTITVNNDTTDSLFLKLDNELIAEWMDTTTSESNYGLYLDSDDDLMLQCYSQDISSEISTGPQIWLYFKDDTTRYPEKYESTSDLFLAESNMDPNGSHLRIESGTAYRSYLEFDLSAFYPNTIINRATITLISDTTKTLPQLDESKGLSACYLDSAFDDFSTAEFKSENSATGNFEDNECVIELTYHIQEIISDELNNLGFLIKGQYETSELSRIIFYSSQADSSWKPKLDITYTLAPDNQL